MLRRDFIDLRTKLALTSMIGALLLVVGCRVAAHAQADGPPLTPQLTLGTDTMRVVRDPQDRPPGIAITDLRRDGPAALRLRFLYDIPGEVHVVTITRVRRSDLTPLEELHDFGQGDSARVLFRANRALLTRWRSAGPRTRDSTEVPPGTLTSAAIDLALRTLPLARGFATQLPVYFMPLQKVVTMPIRVTGVDSVRSSKGRMVPCWILEATFPGPAIERFWIAQKTRELIRVEGHASPGVIERYER